jgi:hypothetical protein
MVTNMVIDRFAIEVRDVAKITPADAKLYVHTFTIVAGGEKEVQLKLTSSDGTELKGVGAVDYAFMGGLTQSEVTLVSAIADAIASIFVGTTTEYAKLSAKAVGTGAVQITAPSGASFTLPAAVVDNSAITAVSISEGDLTETTAGSTTTVDIVAMAGDERAWSPKCDWTIDPPMGDVVITNAARDYAAVTSKVVASAKVTCTINGHAATSTVSFKQAK